MDRRKFLEGSAIMLGTTLIPIALQANSVRRKMALLPDSKNKIDDENYWNSLRLLFEQPKDYINLENGYFSPMPLPTLAAHQGFENHINTRTSWFMRKQQEEAIENARHALSSFLGCNPKELALTRNTTESMNIVISGYPWQKDDEVVIGDQDYGSMVSAFKQAEKRHGIKIKVAKIPLVPQNDEEVVQAYLSQCTSKTRLVHITHLINLTGQVIPVQKISQAAREKGIEVAVDAAHSIGQIPLKISDFQADYVGASLHKWLSNALGTGFLWVHKEKIKNIWPLMADTDFPNTDIRKFEHQGTRPIQSLQTIKTAIDIHESIGGDIKMFRLKYLMKLWCSQVSEIPKVNVLTPWNDDERNSAIATVSVDGFKPSELAELLFKNFNIFTVAIDHPVIKGVRVTPHIFTQPGDVTKLAEALQAIANY